MYNISPGIPTSYPGDAMQCCIDCANGVCKEPVQNRLWAHHVAIGYTAAQAVAAGPCPQPCPPCSVADFSAAHAALKYGGKAATPFNWLALLQLLEPALAAIVQELLTLLIPTPAPTPTP